MASFTIIHTSISYMSVYRTYVSKVVQWRNLYRYVRKYTYIHAIYMYTYTCKKQRLHQSNTSYLF